MNQFAVFAARPAGPGEASRLANSSPRYQKSTGKQSFTETFTRAARELNGNGHEPELSGQEKCRSAQTPACADGANACVYRESTASAELPQQTGPAEVSSDPVNPGTAGDTVRNLVDELIRLLQALGFADGGTVTGQAAAQSEGAESTLNGLAGANKTLQQVAQALAALGESGTVTVKQLKQALEQLLAKLELAGGALPELDTLKTLIKAQLNESTAVPPRDFVSKLSQALVKTAETLPQAPTTVAGEEAGVKPGQKPGEQPVIQSAVNSAEQPGKSAVAGEKLAESTTPGTVSPAGKTVQDSPQVKREAPLGQGQGTAKAAEPENNVNPGNRSANGSANSGNETGQSGSQESLSLNKPHQPGAVTSGRENAIDSRQPVPVQADHGLHLGQNQTQQARASEQHAQAPRTAQVIFGQIVHKAKAVVAPGISEVQIQLKPDFLGRLNLSISSENGLVTAKFNAESYQVKAIIETNLNVLRDALAEQGVKVDQLVVNVSADRDYSGHRERETAAFSNSSGRNGKHEAADGDLIERMFQTDPETSAVRAYYGSAVDFTA